MSSIEVARRVPQLLTESVVSAFQGSPLSSARVLAGHGLKQERLDCMNMELFALRSETRTVPCQNPTPTWLRSTPRLQARRPSTFHMAGSSFPYSPKTLFPKAKIQTEQNAGKRGRCLLLHLSATSLCRTSTTLQHRFQRKCWQPRQDQASHIYPPRMQYAETTWPAAASPTPPTPPRMKYIETCSNPVGLGLAEL